MAMSLQTAISLKKAGGMSLLKAALLMGMCSLGPVEGHPNFPWWNVRFHDGTFYLINHVSQWQEELAMWQVVSLEEAFEHDPEMQVYIMGHSQMGSPSTNYAPIWNPQASQWLLATTPPGPNQQAGQMLDLELLYYRVEEKQRREQDRITTRWSRGQEARKGCDKSWENDPVYWWAHKKNEPDNGWWEEEWGSSHPSSGSARSSWEPDEADPTGPSRPSSSSTPKWSNERYLARGWGSACRRHQRNQYKQRGEPIPEHLKPRPTTGQMAQYYKRQMMSLVRQCQNLAEGWATPPEPEEAEDEPAMADAPTSPADFGGDTSSSEMSVTAPRRSRSMSRGKHGPRTVGRGTPANPERNTLRPPNPERNTLRPEPEKAEPEPEKAEHEPKNAHGKPGKAKLKDPPIKEEEEEDDDESEPENAKHKKKKKRKRKSRGHGKGEDPEKDTGNGGPDKGPGGGPAPEPMAVEAAA